jgi:hypothetical protein
MPNPQSRSRLFVDRDVQGALLKRIVCHWVAFVLSLIVLLVAFQYFERPLDSFDDQVQVFQSRHTVTALVLLVLLPLFVYDALKLTHRFAGPMVRVRRMLGQLAAGEPTDPLHFREGDFWNDVAKNFNAIRTKLQREPVNGQAAARPANGSPNTDTPDKSHAAVA